MNVVLSVKKIYILKVKFRKGINVFEKLHLIQAVQIFKYKTRISIHLNNFPRFCTVQIILVFLIKKVKLFFVALYI